MKFEVKTENEDLSNSFSKISMTVFFLSLIVIFTNIAFKLRVISRHYQIDYYCRILHIEKSATNFKKLSKISNLKSKQKIWEFCRQVFK